MNNYIFTMGEFRDAVKNKPALLKQDMIESLSIYPDNADVSLGDISLLFSVEDAFLVANVVVKEPRDRAFLAMPSIRRAQQYANKESTKHFMDLEAWLEGKSVDIFYAINQAWAASKYYYAPNGYDRYVGGPDLAVWAALSNIIAPTLSDTARYSASCAAHFARTNATVAYRNEREKQKQDIINISSHVLACVTKYDID